MLSNYYNKDVANTKSPAELPFGSYEKKKGIQPQKKIQEGTQV